MIKKLFVLFAILFMSSCSIYSNIDRRLTNLENANNAIQKKLKVLMPGQPVPNGSQVLEHPFSTEDLASAMAGGERAIYIRAFTGLTGGTTGKLDKIANVDLDDNDLALVFDIAGDYSAGAMLMYYWDEDANYTEVVPRYIESDTDGGTSGTWILMNGWVSSASSAPTVSFYDSDGAGTDEWADLLAGSITMNFDTVTEGAETADIQIKAFMGGAEVVLAEWDATTETWTFGDSVSGEDLVWDFDTATDNEVGVSTNSGVTIINWGALIHRLGSIELGHDSDTTIARASAGQITVEGVAVLLSGGAAGTPSSITLTNATANSLPSSAIGTIVDSTYWDAGGMTPDGTQCADAARVTINSGPVQYTVICADNDASSLYGHIVMPDSWDGGTVTFEHEYLQTAADTGVLNGDITCQCRGAAETPSSTWGTEVAIDDAAVTGSNAVDHTTSAAVTCAGTCAGGDSLWWRYQVDATGTTTAVATLHNLGMKMEYTSNVGD